MGELNNLTYIEAMAEDEVFVVTGDEDLDDSPTYIFGNLDDVEDYLKTLQASMDANTRVLHGVLTSAEYLPTDFRNRTVFVVIRSPEDAMSAVVVESGASAPAELAEEIEVLVQTGHHMATIPDIDDVYIFYGYELTIRLTVNWDDVDEEIIDTCTHVAEDAADTRRIAEAKEEYHYHDGD